MFNRKSVVTTLGVLALLFATAGSMYGSETKYHTNYLTFSGPVRLPGVTLLAGTYIFERVEPTNPDVIAVFSKDRSKLYYMAFTNRAYRPADLKGDVPVTFGEARQGMAPPIAAWYPMHEELGHKFIYEGR